MAVCLVMSWLTWRSKYLLLLVLCACIIAWITYLSDGHVKTHERVLKSGEVQVQGNDEQIEMEMEKQDNVDEEQMPENLCPEKSPLLREFDWVVLRDTKMTQIIININSVKCRLKKKKAFI